MHKDIRTYFLFVGLPAVIITAAGLFTLVFGVRGITAEMEFSDMDNQKERYERRIKDRMATRLKVYRRTGRADFVWKAAELPWGTNGVPRAKYGIYEDEGGGTIGWARADADTVIGFSMPPFRAEGRKTLHLFVLGAVMVALLSFVLIVGGVMLARAAKRARDDSETKDSFLDMISHELNTPLGSIVPLSSALAAGRVKDDSRRREALYTISRESARMARMIDELLTVVRLKNGKLVFARERVDMREVSGHAASLVCVRHPDCAIAVEDGAPLYALADADKTEQVLVNLIENACRHASAEEVVVTCRHVDSAGRVRVEVADRGPGFSEAERKRLFERFYQISPGTSDSGLGLGLNIVSGFVAGMGGDVGVEPREGGGSVFFVELPRFGAIEAKEVCDGRHTCCR